MNLKQNLIYIRDLRDLYHAREVTSSGNVSYANWWAEDPETAWFTKLVRYICPEGHTPVRFYSMFGPKRNVEKPFDGVKVFYCGENLEERLPVSSLVEREEKVKGWEHRRRTYSDYCISITDFSIGFGHHDEWDTYMRFPLWVMRYFEPDWGIEQIRIRLAQMEEQPVNSDRKGAALIASHDFMGTRAGICDAIDDITDISYAGKWRNTTDALWTEYHNDKELYLKQFMFSICPENTDAPGYATEKVFDAIAAGTIPIYYGDRNHPEPEILNYDSIIFWDYEDSASVDRNRELITRLQSDKAFYRSFMERPRFAKDAAEIIDRQMTELKNRLLHLLQ